MFSAFIALKTYSYVNSCKVKALFGNHYMEKIHVRDWNYIISLVQRSTVKWQGGEAHLLVQTLNWYMEFDEEQKIHINLNNLWL